MSSTVSTVITKLVHDYGNVSTYCNETAVKTKTLALAVKENIVYRNIWLGNTYKRERQRERRRETEERDRGERQRERGSERWWFMSTIPQGKTVFYLIQFKNGCLAVFFHMLTQSVRFYTIQRVQMFEKDYSSNRQ